MICTFFGHRDTLDDVAILLDTVLTDLIENKNVDVFYVGNQGNFDKIVKRQLDKMKKTHPYIRYFIVLAYLPTKKDSTYTESYDCTIYPQGLETVPPKYAISKRNEWMISKSDYVVTYVKKSFGGAFKFKNLALTKGKNVIEISKK